MKILLVAATHFEISLIMTSLKNISFSEKSHEINTLITGVGLLNTTYHLTQYLQDGHPDLMIQAGIGGSFGPQYPLTSTWLIQKEYLGDLGVEESEIFEDMFDKGFMNSEEYPFSKKSLENNYSTIFNKIQLPTTSAVSVNEISTRHHRINQLIKKYNPGIESMEGAAFHFVALQKNIPFLQIRSVSNFVGERNKNNWRIQDAIIQLNHTLEKLIISL